MRIVLKEYIYGCIQSCIGLNISSHGHNPEIVRYMPIIMGIKATINIHIAKILPNLLTALSAFADEKRTKYPMVVKIVAGIKLMKMHMSFPPLLLNLFALISPKAFSIAV